jgi:hypothetical protein
LPWGDLLLEDVGVESGGASACQALADLIANIAEPKLVQAISLIQKPQAFSNDLEGGCRASSRSERGEGVS